MSTQPAESPQPSYWQLPATKWDAAKTACPILIAVVWALITLWFNSQAAAQNIAKLQEQNATIFQAKEDRGTRLSVVENEVKAMHDEQQKNDAQTRDELKEMRGDIKTILREMPKGSN